MTEPRIYVADLAAYNAGVLHGVWIDACDDLDDIYQQVKAMLQASPTGETAEEYAIHDYEGFEGIPISEYQGLESVHEIACFIEERGLLGVEVLKHFDDKDEATKALDEAYHGCYASLADYAEEFTTETTEIPQHLQYYIDYERMARDWELSGDIFTVTTAHDEMHVFSGI